MLEITVNIISILVNIGILICMIIDLVQRKE